MILFSRFEIERGCDFAAVAGDRELECLLRCLGYIAHDPRAVAAGQR